MEVSKVLTSAQVQEIRARAEKATPGPHQTRYIYRMIHAMREHGLRLGLMMGPDTGKDWADADLWANSQSDIPALCDSHEEMELENERLTFLTAELDFGAGGILSQLAWKDRVLAEISQTLEEPKWLELPKRISDLTAQLENVQEKFEKHQEDFYDTMHACYVTGLGLSDPFAGDNPVTGPMPEDWRNTMPDGLLSTSIANLRDRAEKAEAQLAERDRVLAGEPHGYCQMQTEPHCSNCRKPKERHYWNDKWAADGACKDDRGRPEPTKWEPVDPLPCNCWKSRILTALPSAPVPTKKTVMDVLGWLGSDGYTSQAQRAKVEARRKVPAEHAEDCFTRLMPEEGDGVSCDCGAEKPAPPTLTPEQTRLARHALGLPNKSKASYRNRFIVGLGSDSFSEWAEMEAAGLAAHQHDETGSPSVSYFFWLTEAGARAALLEGEKLDKEDFPK